MTTLARTAPLQVLATSDHVRVAPKTSSAYDLHVDVGSKLTVRDGEKLASKLALEDGETVVFVAFCSNWKPTTIERLVITNRRVLASPSMWPKVVWEARLDAVTCAANVDEKSVTVTPIEGEPLTFKKVPVDDHARILGALGAAERESLFDDAAPDAESVPAPTLARSHATAPEVEPAEKKQGMYAKAVAAAKKMAEEAEAKYTRGVAEAGHLVLSKPFGSSTVEVYENGFVRVSAMMSKATPFEKLRAVKYTQQVQDKSAGGRALAGAMTMGLSYLASNEKRTLFLTIATDRKVHSLTTSGEMLRMEDKAGLSIEAACQGVLAAGPSPQVVVQVPAAGPAPQGDSLADQITKLSDLHKAGILSDEEFAEAKRKLISGN